MNIQYGSLKYHLYQSTWNTLLYDVIDVVYSSDKKLNKSYLQHVMHFQVIKKRF